MAAVHTVTGPLKNLQLKNPPTEPESYFLIYYLSDRAISLEGRLYLRKFGLVGVEYIKLRA